MKYLYVICVVVTASLRSFCSDVQPNLIDLTDQLKSIAKCTTTILTAKIIPKQNRSINYLSFYELLLPTYFPTVRFVEEYKLREYTVNRQLQCDQDYYKLAAGSYFASGMDEDNKIYPFNKIGCNVFVYVSPPQCKDKWDIPELTSSNILYFLRPDFLKLFQGSRYSYNADVQHIVSTNFAQFVIIIQKEKMYLPLRIMHTLDFDPGMISLKEEYQSYKLIFAVSESRRVETKRLEVTSIYSIPSWQFENSKKEAEVRCRSLGYSSWKNCQETINEKYDCKPETPKCTFPYKTYQFAEHAIAQLQAKPKITIAWSILGIPTDSIKYSKIDSDQFAQTDGNAMALRNWENDYSIDVLLLSLVSPNATMYIGEGIGSDSMFFIPPISTLRIYTAPEAYYGFRRSSNGIGYVTCAWDLGNEWIFSFTGFISIFDMTTWILFITFGSFAGIILVVSIEKKLRNFADTIWYLMFSIIVVLEQGFNVPKEIRLPKLTIQSNHFVPIFTTWIIVGVVLSNAYRGSNIDNLIAPIPEKRYELFDQIQKRNFSIYTELVGGPVYNDLRNTSLGDAIQAAYFIVLFRNDPRLKEFVEAEMAKTVRNYPMSWILDPPKRYKKAIELFVYNLKLPRTYGDLFDSYESGYFVGKLAGCNSEAFVGNYDSLYKVYLQLREYLRRNLWNGYKGDKFDPNHVSLSKEPLMPGYKTRVFYNLEPDLKRKLTKRIYLLGQSGLEKLWIEWADFWKKWNFTVELSKEKGVVRSLSLLRSNIKVVFLIFGGILALPVLVFVGEVFCRVLIRLKGLCKRKGNFMDVNSLFVHVQTNFQKVKK